MQKDMATQVMVTTLTSNLQTLKGICIWMQRTRIRDYVCSTEFRRDGLIFDVKRIDDRGFRFSLRSGSVVSGKIWNDDSEKETFMFSTIKKLELECALVGTGDTSCKSCPSGFHATEEGSKICDSCSEGQFSDVLGNAGPCESCPSGYFSNSPYRVMSVPKYDLGGGYGYAGKEILLQHPLDFRDSEEYSCPALLHEGNIFTDTKDKRRAANKVFALENLGSLLVVTPLECIMKVETLGCRAITFPFEFECFKPQMACQRCPGGWFQDDEASSNCKPCGKSKRSADSASTCASSCPPGSLQVSSSSHICRTCASGMYSASSSSESCTLCPVGYHSMEGLRDQCTACKDGFVSGPGQTHCNECPAGTYADSEKTACSVCPAGSFSSEKGVSGVRSCEKCAENFTLPDDAQTASEHDSIEDCKPCPPATFSNPGDRYCERCSVGKHLTRVHGKLICEVCDAGKYQNQEGQSSCRSCLPGESQDSKSSQYCLPCAPGRFASEAGSSKCMECPTGYVQASPGETNCTMCNDGSGAQVRIEAVQCVKCNVGEYGVKGKGICNKCLEHSYSDEAGQVACKACEEGKAADAARISCAYSTEVYAQVRDFQVDLDEGSITFEATATNVNDIHETTIIGYVYQISTKKTDAQMGLQRVQTETTTLAPQQSSGLKLM